MIMNTVEIRTKRLILRRFKEDDMFALFDIFSDIEANKFLPWYPLKSLEDAKDFYNERYTKEYEKPCGYKYAICLKTDNIPIGYVNVSTDEGYDFGYGLRKEFWHKGIVSEASKAVIEKLKADGVPYITATHDVNNPRSGSVMKAMGMTYQYSYEELWRPKNFLVTFRMYQLNLSDASALVYKKYWDTYPNHFVEKGTDYLV